MSDAPDDLFAWEDPVGLFAPGPPPYVWVLLETDLHRRTKIIDVFESEAAAMRHTVANGADIKHRTDTTRTWHTPNGRRYQLSRHEVMHEVHGVFGGAFPPDEGEQP